MYDLKGKVAVVTGASSGIGADAAIAYAEAGARVAVLARRKGKLDSVVKEIEKLGGKALAVECDVTNEAQVKAAFEEIIKEFGQVDILLNNAGIAVRGGVDTLSEEDWDKSMDVNVKGIFFACKYAVPHMKERKYGKIVNVASVNALIADKQDMFIRHGYNTSKSAVLGLSLGMAASYGKFNITVNSICPGLFETEMTEGSLFKSDAFLKGYSAGCPMDRPGRKGECNGPILFFSSDASSYVTGQKIVIDGGSSLV